MQKIYKIVLVLLSFFVTFNQTNAQIANCCAECQADVKAVSDKQVLLEKIEIPKGSVATNVSTNIYVSYRSGDAQKFWTNLAIATAGIAVSTQVGSSSTPITAGDSRTQSSSISPAIPLGVSAALIPSIWKNRPRGVPQAGIYVQHRDLRGKLTQSWEQAISSEAKNSAELLTVAIDKPLSEGTLEVYLQNGSKNEVFYWGLQTVKNMVKIVTNTMLANINKPSSARSSEHNCPQGSTWQGDPYNRCVQDPPCDGEGCSNNNPEVPQGTTPGLGTNPGSTGLPEVGVFGGGDTGNPTYGSGGGGGYDPTTPPDDGTNQPNPYETGPNYGSSGGGNENGDEDRPQTKNQGFHFDMLKGDGSYTGDYLTPVVTSYESGTLTRPNSRSQWRFQSFSFLNIGIQGRFLFEVWTASTLSPISNIEPDGFYVSMDHTWQLTRNAALGEIIIGGAGTSTRHQNSYGYNAN